MPRLPILPITSLVSSNSKIVCGGTPKKTGPHRGPGSVIADVGAGNVFQRGTCCLPAILGGYPSGETASGKYAKRAAQRQYRSPHDCHAQSQFVRIRRLPRPCMLGRENFTAQLWWESQKCQRWAFATRKSRKT